MRRLFVVFLIGVFLLAPNARNDNDVAGVRLRQVNTSLG